MTRYALLPVFFITACTGNLETGTDPVIQCDAVGECPTGFVCQPEASRCVRATETGTLSVIDSEFFPAFAGPEELVELRVTFDTPPLRVPSGSMSFGEEALNLEFLALTPQEYSSVFTVPAAADDGSAQARVTGIDPVGALVEFSIDGLTIDTVPPIVAPPEWSLSRAAVNGRVAYVAESELNVLIVSASLLDEDDREIAPLAPVASPVLGVAQIRESVDLSRFALESASAVIVSLVVSDRAGNTVAVRSDPLPLESDAPETVLTQTPAADSERLRAEFEFSSPADDVASFRCRLDDGPLVECTSPFEQVLRTEGSHRFEVAAVDTVGLVDATPAVFEWTETRRWTTEVTSGCAVASDGSLWCWGDNEEGEVGLGLLGGEILAPARVGRDVDWLSVERSGSGACALKVDGSLWCWGEDVAGDGALGFRVSPTRVDETGPWRAVALSKGDACAIKDDGSLWCWGINEEGQTASGDLDPVVRPQRVDDSSGWLSVRLSSGSACGVKRERNVNAAYCWGRSSAAQPVTGDTPTFTRPERLPFANWSILQPLGTGEGCGIRGAPGTLWCWGTIGDFREEELTQLGAANDWVDVVASSNNVCARNSTGAVFCFGSLVRGVDRTRPETQSGTPVRAFPGALFSDVSVISDRGGAVCGMSLRREIQCIGNPSQGKLGGGPSGVRSSSHAFADLSAWDDTSCAIDVASSELRCWGLAGQGQFRDDFDVHDAPSRVGNEEILVGTTTNSHGCGIERGNGGANAILCWGTQFQPGWNFDDPPVRQGPTGNWADVALSNSAFDRHSVCAIRETPTGGTLWCWGECNDGQCGLGSASSIEFPTQVGSSESYERGWTQVRMGEENSCGLRRGEMWCFGDDHEPTPTRVGTASDWAAVATGRRATCGIRGSSGGGSLWCWGKGFSGQLGLGDLEDADEPTQVGTDTDWLTVAGSNDAHFCAAKTDGRVWCWGDNTSGEVSPDWTPDQSLTPVRVPQVNGAVEIAVGARHSCALSPSVLYCWGDAESGQLGDGMAFGPTTIPKP